MLKTSITIIGSCISNQIIRVAAREGKSEWLVKGATTLLSPFSLGTDAVQGMEKLLDQFDEETEMYSFSIAFGITKDFKKICRGKYLVVDLGTLNHPCYELKKGQCKYLISKRPAADISKHNGQLIYDFAREGGYEIREISEPLFQMDKEEQKEYLKGFALKLLEVCEPSKIIMIDARWVLERIRWDGAIELEGFNRKKTIELDTYGRELQDYFAGLLEGIMRVRLPQNTLADDDAALHTNGSSTHYGMDAYEYLRDALSICTDEIARGEKEEKLEELLVNAERIHEEKILMHMRRSCELLKDYKNVCSYDYYAAKQQIKDKSYLENVQTRYGLAHERISIRDGLSLDEYINQIWDNKEDYILFLAARETVNKHWKKWKTRGELGLETDMSECKRKSYCAIVDWHNGNVKELFDNTEHELILTYQIWLQNTDISVDKGSSLIAAPDIFFASVSSKGRYKEEQYQWARIMINNINYAIDKIGLNFVVFSRKAHCVVDSFYVNFWGDPKLLVRRR